MVLLLWYSLYCHYCNKLTMLIYACGQSTGSREDYKPHALPCADGGGGKNRFVPSGQVTLEKERPNVLLGRSIGWDCAIKARCREMSKLHALITNLFWESWAWIVFLFFFCIWLTGELKSRLFLLLNASEACRACITCIAPVQTVMSWHLIILKKDWGTHKGQGLLLSVTTD